MSERNDEFDGYRKWLGIANKKRPPTHYELLAISLDEDDPEVIRAAAEQRRHYVETKRGDGHDSVVTEILYRIGEAETTLLNDEMRRDYDRQLNLFEKRRKNRQVDPFASPSRIRSQPGRTVGEDSGIVKTFVGIMAVVVIGFGGMAWFSFGLPWSKPVKQPEAVPVVQNVVDPQSVPQPVEQPARVSPAVAQADPQTADPVMSKDATGEVINEVDAQTPPNGLPEVAQPVVAKDDGPIPEFLNLDEINSEEAEASPWISPDGLTLYWTAKEVGGKDGDNWIWSASRKTPEARFEARTRLFRGTFPVVSSDGLEMIFKPLDIDGFSVATRKAVSEPFARPRQITELSIAGSYSKPRCLSHNGRSLYFDRDKPNGKNNDTWVTTRENRGAKWQAPTPLKYAIPGVSQEARFTQVCLTQNELHMFCTAALPKTGTDEDIHPAVLSRKTPDGEFTSYQRLTLGNDARDISGWRVFRYCETTKEFVITDKGRRNDLFLVKNVPIPAVEKQAASSPEKGVKETETNAAAASWKFWDVFGNGIKKDTLIVARDGMLLSPAHDKAFCLTTLKEYAGLELKLEFQFQSAEGLGNPYLGVVSTLPNPDASDWKQQIPRSVEIKLAPQIAGELVLPTADFKVKLNEVQKIHNARHIAPINKAEVKLREWNTLEVKCSEDSKLIVKINGVTVNRLEGMQTNKGHVVIWPANAEMRLRNAVVVVDSNETKLSFETLE